jgi:diacylglycerol O-acyltransferase
MERLTAQDLITLWPDDVGWPQDIGALAVLDGSRLFDQDGRFRLEAVRTMIEGRLHLVPRFRQVLSVPGWGLGRPLWVDATSFDVSHHVRVAPLPEQGDGARLLEGTEALRRRRLDRSRPLWEMWFLTGLPGRRVGLYLKVHHVIADGPAAVTMLGALLDAPEADPVTGRPWTPAPAPSARDLFENNLRRQLSTPTRVFKACSRPGTIARGTRAVWRAVREAFVEGLAPRTSFNRPIGPDRRFTLVRSRLDLVTEIAHRHDATVNDVLLTAAAGGLRDLLGGRGDPVEDVLLRALVPVSLHHEPHGEVQGNLLGSVIVPLPIGVADPGQRLRLIAAATAQRKREGRAQIGAVARNGVLPRASVRILARQRLENTYVSNVPGPPAPLSLAGAPLLEIFPLVPLIGNLTLAVGALSYAGQFNLTAISDPATCPDVDVFVHGLTATLQTLKTSLFGSRSGTSDVTPVGDSEHVDQPGSP